jgi:hypothetical protein
LIDIGIDEERTMTHSLIQETELACPECGQSFTAEIWLIVDTAEHPDLLEEIRQGKLHDLPCPQCGHSGQVDAPLLLYRPDANPPLLFSPAEGTTAEQDREQAAGLVGTLRERMGPRWRDEWVARGLPGVPRHLLPTALSGDLESVVGQAAEQVQQAQQAAAAAREALDDLPPQQRVRAFL